MIGESDYPTYIVTLGVRLFESYGEKSWILVDFLVDPIIHTYIPSTYMLYLFVLCTYIHT